MDKSKITHYIKLITIPVAVALVFRFVFDIKTWDDILLIMSLSFFFGLPYLVGVITIYLSKIKDIKKGKYQVLFPWVPIFAFFIVTLALSIEGFACWIMILPIFLGLSSLGGITAARVRLKKSKSLDRLQISIAILIPFILSPIEQAIGPSASIFKANTAIEIKAPKKIIWGNVTRVKQISVDEDNGKINKWLGIPRPLEAELNFEGLHAVRKAIFTDGLIFNEVVTKYEDQKLMEFSIEPNTGEIPATTFDDHVLIGGQYFDVLKGTYEIEELESGNYLLKLTSEFELNTTFNFYSGLWAKWIMEDIQNNILEIIKARSESK